MTVATDRRREEADDSLSEMALLPGLLKLIFGPTLTGRLNDNDDSRTLLFGTR